MIMHTRKSDLQGVIAAMQRQWGTNVVRPLADLPTSTRLPGIPTGFSALDGLLACRGIPQRHLTVLTGFPTAGTTTLAYHLIAQAQRRQQVAVYLDLHQSFDPLYARRCGVEIDALLLLRPENLIEASALLRDLAVEATPLLAVLDGLRLSQPLPDLRAVRAVLPRSQTTLLLLLPPALAHPLSPDVSLHLERREWRYHRRDVQGYLSRITVMQDMGRATGTQVELEITV